MTSDPLAQERTVTARRDWRAVYDHLRPVRDSLGLDDLATFAEAAWWMGDTPDAMAIAEDVYQRVLAEGSLERAADCALRLMLAWATRGDVQVAEAWHQRATRLIDQLPPGRLHGLALYMDAAWAMDVEGDPAPAEAGARRLHELAADPPDPMLGCFARVLEGMAAIRRGRTADGFAALDEAMLPVLAGKVEPLWAGDIYCTTIHLSDGLGDLTRMRQWTEALARWAGPLSDTFMYAGVTRVHELQLVAAEGGWDVVEAELGRESERLIGAHGWLSGTGFYELGEIRRMRGDVAGARAAFDRARDFGLDPQPGAALLLRAEGRPAEALAELRVSLAERTRLDRARLLLPAVELALETGDPGARALADELAATADFYDSPGFRARAAQARALIALSEERPADALPALEDAAAVYRDQRFRYAVATVHEQLGRAHRALGDATRAAADEATALAIYERLGARPDLDRLAPRDLPAGLTVREAEVLARVAAGATNKEVAASLVISEKTVGRHLANIFTKLGVSTRTAAAAWARKHGVA